MQPYQKITVLRFLMLWAGIVMLLAIPAIVMPTAWMVNIHEIIGLGTFPASPLVTYLTRSVALVYAVHGGLLILLSRDVTRLAPVIVYLGCSNIVFGCVVTGIDLYAPMPIYWTLMEGPPVAAFGAILLWLVKGIGSSEPA